MNTELLNQTISKLSKKQLAEIFPPILGMAETKSSPLLITKTKRLLTITMRFLK